MTNEEMNQKEWHALSAEDVLDHLEVHDEGLSSAEAEKRLAHYGQNQLR